MLARHILAFALLAAPVFDAAAQRLPTQRTPGPARPAPLPPQAPEIARVTAYRRMPYSFESYPMVSFQQASAAVRPGLTSWVSAGFGERLDYRVSPRFSATFDVTSSFFGSPLRTETAELGARFRPQTGEGRLYPFIDARFGYLQTYQAQFQPYDVVDPYGAGAPAPGSRWSNGFGAVAGAGIEYRLSRMFSVTTGASVMRSRLTSRSFLSAEESIAYWLTSYRYTIGLRFNPVRAVRTPPPPYPSSATR